MKSVFRASAVFVSVFLGAICANAADLGTKKPGIAAPIMTQFNWTGFYVGVQGGYQWGRTSNRFYGAGGVLLPASSRNHDTNGAVLGAHAGYTYQFNPGDGFVIGAEGDIEWTSTRGTFTFVGGDQYRAKGDLQGSVRLRAGYALNRILVYATGGAAFSNLNNSIFNAGTGVRVRSNVDIGWTVGGGVEYAITRNWSARAEYRYTAFSEKKYDASAAFPGTVGAENNLHTVRAGVSYRF